MKRVLFRKGWWARQSILAQSASNVSGLLHSAIDCLRDWRASEEGKGDFNGTKCIPLNLMMFHATFLMGAHHGIAYKEKNYPGDYSVDYQEMNKLADSINVSKEAVEHFILAEDITKAITYYDAKLDEDQKAIFCQWARDNYSPLDTINPYWHEVVKEECATINIEWEETVPGSDTDIATAEDDPDIFGTNV